MADAVRKSFSDSSAPTAKVWNAQENVLQSILVSSLNHCSMEERLSATFAHTGNSSSLAVAALPAQSGLQALGQQTLTVYRKLQSPKDYRKTDWKKSSTNVSFPGSLELSKEGTLGLRIGEFFLQLNRESIIEACGGEDNLDQFVHRNMQPDTTDGFQAVEGKKR